MLGQCWPCRTVQWCGDLGDKRQTCWDGCQQVGWFDATRWICAPSATFTCCGKSSSSPPTRDFVPFSGKAMKLASDEETKVVKIDEEKRTRSRDISFNCPHCNCKLLFQNSIEINPKGVKCRCNGCSFKLSRNDKTMNVSRDDNGEIKLDSEDHSISFSFNSITTPPQNEEQRKIWDDNKMLWEHHVVNHS